MRAVGVSGVDLGHHPKIYIQPTETKMIEGGHIPVMLAPVLELLELDRGKLRILDATFGGGGHTRAFLERGHSVLALDCDPEARERAEVVQEQFPEHFAFAGLNFEDLDEATGPGSVDSILFDFGLSSFHLDTPERGFSFRYDAPLDMRLNTREGMTAAEFLEKADREELIQAVKWYGEEPSWRRVVEAILEARGSGKLARTASLAALIEEAIPRRPGPPPRIHPATRTFQGLRIVINRELKVIEAALPKAFEALAPGGRLAAISFHSLEDRIVKRFFRRMAGAPEHSRDSIPQQLRTVSGRILTRRPIVSSETEVQANPRSRSAKLRVLEKLED